MEGSYPTVYSVKMADVLASSYNFQFKFNLKIENCKFQ